MQNTQNTKVLAGGTQQGLNSKTVPKSKEKSLTSSTISPREDMATPNLSTGAPPPLSAEWTEERLKFREEQLRKEIRAGRKQMLTLQRWGVGVLVVASGFFCTIRHQILDHLIQIHSLPPTATLPAARWFVGSVFLTIIATLFWLLNKYITRRHVAYRRQLLDSSLSYSGIIEGPTGGKINHLPVYLFFAFPVFDVALYFYYTAAVHTIVL